jgi:hypothetical protein
MNNNDIGFIITNTENSYFNIISNLFDTLQENYPLNQHTIFCSTLKIKTNRLGIPVLPLSEAQFFIGNLFIFDLYSLLNVKNFVNIHNIYYYMNTISWQEMQNNQYTDMYNLFNQNKLHIIAANEIIYHLCTTCWKKPLCIAKDLNYDSIKNFI